MSNEFFIDELNKAIRFGTVDEIMEVEQKYLNAKRAEFNFAYKHQNDSLAQKDEVFSNWDDMRE